MNPIDRLCFSIILALLIGFVLALVVREAHAGKLGTGIAAGVGAAAGTAIASSAMADSETGTATGDSPCGALAAILANHYVWTRDWGETKIRQDIRPIVDALTDACTGGNDGRR